MQAGALATALEQERRDAVRFVPEWLAEPDGTAWLLTLAAAQLGCFGLALYLLVRPPHLMVHDRITGARIVARRAGSEEK